MKNIEKILGAIILLAIIMKLNLLPGGSFILGISISCLILIYYPLGFAFFNGIRFKQIFKKGSYQGISRLRILGAIGTGIGLSAISLGVLFKIENLIGGDLYLSTGLIVLFVPFIMSFLKFKKKRSVFYKQILMRIMILGGFGLVLYLIPAMTITKIQYRNHPDYIEAYENYIMNPDNEKLFNIKEIELHKATMTDEEFKNYMDYQSSQTENE